MCKVMVNVIIMRIANIEASTDFNKIPGFVVGDVHVDAIADVGVACDAKFLAHVAES